MPGQTRPDLESLEAYSRSCLKIAAERLGAYGSIEEIAAAEDEINAYPHLDRLSDPRDVFILDEDQVDPGDLQRAREAVLAGRVFWEHTAAGEATRLKLGTKYMILPARDLPTLEDMAGRMADELGREVTTAEVKGKLEALPGDLAPLSLGQRHLRQLAFDLTRLAEEAGVPAAEVLGRQKTLVIVNEKTADAIAANVRQAGFFGLARENFMFMVQPAFPGITLKDGRFSFDPDSPRRLHNHGQLVMQETMDDQIFRLDQSGGREYLKAEEFGGILASALDKISYNIEDLGYLTGSLDWPSLALALSLGARDYNMVMEIVANDPDKPIKGGLAAFDEVLGRNVMIESFQLKGVPNEEIGFLNKNFNHYANPKVSWDALRTEKLPMPIVVKKGYLYFQPIQGDINFLVKTAFVRRRVLKPIRSWKSAANIPEAVNAMAAQDRQPGFLDFREFQVEA